MKTKPTILYLALGLTFLAMAGRSFFTPDDVHSTIDDSVVFASILRQVPIQLIGMHDAIVGILLIFRIYPKYVTAWATLWVGVVILLLLTHMNLDGALDALEHATPFGVALYLSINAFTSKKAEKG